VLTLVDVGYHIKGFSFFPLIHHTSRDHIVAAALTTLSATLFKGVY